MSLAPFFSIIIPSYNKEKYIGETFISLSEQTMSDFEVIVVDDSSKDNTVKIINKFANKDSRIKVFVNEVNKGANYCRNFGIKQAKASYIIFLDADDMLDPFCLEGRQKKIVEQLDKNIWVFTMAVFRNKRGDDNYLWLPSTPDPLKDFLSHKLPWQTMQPVWSKPFIENLDGFDLAFNRLQDVELHTRALLTSDVNYALFNGTPDCYYRIDGDRKSDKLPIFLEKWMIATNAYCNKFENLVPKRYKSYLYGTVLQSYLQLLHHYRQNEINVAVFDDLKKLLMKSPFVNNAGNFRKALFACAEFYNKHLPQISGVNWLIKKLIIT